MAEEPEPAKAMLKDLVVSSTPDTSYSVRGTENIIEPITFSSSVSHDEEDMDLHRLATLTPVASSGRQGVSGLEMLGYSPLAPGEPLKERV